MLYGIKLFTNRVHCTHHPNQHKHSLEQSRGKENKKMKNYTPYNKTLVDVNDTLWNMDYDPVDNSVTLTSDYAVKGGYAVVELYSVDNGLGHGIPDHILYAAEAMLLDIPEPFDDALDLIIDDHKQSKVLH
jgi:hypothetical protein